MALTPRLDLRQTQSLVMTPQLQQAIKLLQLSNQELAAYVESEIEGNPLLEYDDDQREGGESGAEGDPAPPGGEPPPLEAADAARGPEAAQSEPPLDTDSDNLWGGDGEARPSAFAQWGGGGRSGGGEDGALAAEQNASRATTLREHLLEQINVDLTDPIDRIIGVHLVELVDEAGYLVGDLDQVAAVLSCGAARVAATLDKLQRFDPAGVFARNLKECLALQLRERDRLDPAMAALLDNLELLAKRDFARLTRLCGIGSDDLAEMVAEIKALDPKPGLAFDGALSPPITPDVLMRPSPGGGWIIELNQDTLPRVLVNNRYFARVCRGARTKADKEFISERFQSANWLVKSLHQRANTILKVATEIVRQQDAFFRLGVQHLRPLVLRDIAAAIEMHESTVSRVTSNKYLAAPQGIYELKYFFTSAIQSADGGESHSAEAVRFRIKALIEAEQPGDILSDDRIVVLLVGDGVDIARRTVAKYREAMRIPSSVRRRRDKAIGL